MPWSEGTRGIDGGGVDTGNKTRIIYPSSQHTGEHTMVRLTPGTTVIATIKDELHPNAASQIAYLLAVGPVRSIIALKDGRTFSLGNSSIS
jgi:hypothetical protein